MTEREIFKKYDNLSENELKAKNNKEVYAKNDVITTAIKCWRGDILYILFRIDVNFFEYLLAVEIDEKGHTDRDLTFEEKRQEALGKKTWL